MLADALDLNITLKCFCREEWLSCSQFHSDTMLIFFNKLEEWLEGQNTWWGFRRCDLWLWLYHRCSPALYL